MIDVRRSCGMSSAYQARSVWVQANTEEWGAHSLPDCKYYLLEPYSSRVPAL